MCKKNLVANIAGVALPTLAALLAIPKLIDILGLERFGLLSLGWMLVGFWGLLDFGLARAITHAVSSESNHRTTAFKHALSNRLALLMCSLGVLWAVVLALAAPWLATKALSVPLNLQQEVLHACYWMALQVPIMLFVNARLAVLEGQHRFVKTNFLKVPFGMAMFLLPLGVSFFSVDMGHIFAALFGLRVLFALSLFWGVWSKTHSTYPLTWQETKSSLVFSGWLAVSNVVGPMLTYFDRFYISAFLGLTAVAYYTIPYDLLMRFLVLPIAIMGVVFPLLTQSLSKQAYDGVEQALSKSLNWLLWLWLPVLSIAMIFAKPLLTLWLGDDTAIQIWQIAQVFLVGVFINGLAMILYNLLQAKGRTDLTAKFHLLELPIYAAVFVVAIAQWQLLGAALAWALRAWLDFMLLWWGSRRVFSVAFVAVKKIMFVKIVVVVFMLLWIGYQWN